MTQYKADKDMLTWRDNGVKGRRRIAVILHTDESAFDYAKGKIRDTAWTADQLAQYNIDAPNDPNRGSYHIGIDRSGRAVRQNDDVFGTWSVGNIGNDTCFHICFTGTAYQSRDQWLSQPKQLARGAEIVAHYCKEYGIDIRRIDANDLRAGRTGIGGHGDCTVAWGGTHWDPGGYTDRYRGQINNAGGFPWDVFITMVKNAAQGITQPTLEKEKTMTPDERAALDDVRHQLTGSRSPGTYHGWPQLGGRTLVDAVAAIGEKLGVDGMKAPKKA